MNLINKFIYEYLLQERLLKIDEHILEEVYNWYLSALATKVLGRIKNAMKTDIERLENLVNEKFINDFYRKSKNSYLESNYDFEKDYFKISLSKEYKFESDFLGEVQIKISISAYNSNVSIEVNAPDFFQYFDLFWDFSDGHNIDIKRILDRFSLFYQDTIEELEESVSEGFDGNEEYGRIKIPVNNGLEATLYLFLNPQAKLPSGTTAFYSKGTIHIDPYSYIDDKHNIDKTRLLEVVEHELRHAYQFLDYETGEFLHKSLRGLPPKRALSKIADIEGKPNKDIDEKYLDLNEPNKRIKHYLRDIEFQTRLGDSWFELKETFSRAKEIEHLIEKKHGISIEISDLLFKYHIALIGEKDIEQFISKHPSDISYDIRGYIRSLVWKSDARWLAKKLKEEDYEKWKAHSKILYQLYKSNF